MTKQSGGDTINRGPAAKPDESGSGPVAGNAREQGEDPSPDDRERGETSSADRSAVDLGPAHDRAS